MSDARAIADPLEIAARWHSDGHAVAIATVIEVWGSAPSPPGSHLVVRDDGHFEGSISGGCVEADVLAEAQDVMANGKPRMVQYGVSDPRAWEVGLPCGGNIRIFIESVT